MNAPKLNEKIKCCLKEDDVKRDKYLYTYQSMMGSSLSLTATTLSMILNDKNEPLDRDELLQYLSDAVKINADLFHSWIIARKIYITPQFDKKIKTALDKVETTEYLFGNNVKELINNVKTVERVSKEKKKILTPNNSLNWRGSSGRKETIPMNPMNRGASQYFVSRNRESRGGRRQREFTQTQPMQTPNKQ